MKLTQLLAGITDVGSVECEIVGLCNDSRQLSPQDVFVAYAGAHADGRLYLRQAAEQGAAAVLYDPLHLPAHMEWPVHLPCIPVPELVSKLAQLATRLYQNPSSGMRLIGVTGTNGKTTVAYQLAQAYGLLGQQVAYMGTIGQGRVAALQPMNNTTPDALYLNKLLASYRQQAIDTVCLEVSSHALSLGRVAEVLFRQALFTNLTQDHLDFHQSMTDYALAKAKLFAMPGLEYAIVNQDDAYHEYMLRALPIGCQRLTVGLSPTADIVAHAWHSSMQGTDFTVATPWGSGDCHIRMLGAFNVYNTLFVIASLLASGHALTDILSLLPRLQSAKGRLEVVHQEPCVIVDYAHTPDALKNVLSTLQPLKKGQLWVVFGCGGDRDKSKRPLMGQIASQYADHVVVTSDNPRNESAQAILADIQQGIPSTVQPWVIADRRQAIETTLAMAQASDIVLIAGKGHEAYQVIGQNKTYFSDQQVVIEWMQR